MTKGAPSFLGRLRSDLTVYVPAQLLSNVLNTVALAVFTRVLDRGEYGTYTLLLSGAMLVSEFAFGWYHASVFRYWHGAAKEGGDVESRFLSTSTAILGALLLITTAAWPLLALGLLPGIDASKAWWGLPLLVGLVSARVVLSRTRALRDLRAGFWYQLLPQTTNIALGSLLVVVFDFGALGVVASLAVGSLAVVAIDLARRWGRYVPRQFQLSRADLDKLVGYGIPVLISSVGGTLLFFSDRFLLAHFFGAATAGVFILGYNLAFKIDQISIVMLSGAFPLLLQDFESKPRHEVGESLSHLIALASAVLIPAAVGLALVARPLGAVLLGAEFQDASAYVVLLMPGVVASALSKYFTKPFQLASNTRPQIYLHFFAAAPQLALNLALLRTFGPFVAAVATSVGWTCYAVAAYVWSKRYLPYRIDWRSTGRVLLCSVGMSACVALALLMFTNPWLELVGGTIVGIATYAGLALVVDIPGASRTARGIVGRLSRQVGSDAR